MAIQIELGRCDYWRQTDVGWTRIATDKVLAIKCGYGFVLCRTFPSTKNELLFLTHTFYSLIFQLSGAVEDLVTRLRFRAAIDLQTWKAYARVGFRTERLSPINVMEGFTLMKRLPLDGNKGNVKLEVKANFALPEPEIEYSTETQRSLVGMGDIEVSIDELNLLLDY